MSRLLVLLLLPAFAACVAAPSGPEGSPAPTEIAGVLSGETVLAGEVVLAGDVLVPRGSRLIIRPGTTLHVQVAESTRIDPEYLSAATELLVRGTLQIEGTEQQPVRFVTGPAPEGSGVAWAGIELDGAVASRIVGAQIERADVGILCIGSSPEIRGCTLDGCRYGLVLQGSSPQVAGNQVENGEGGVFCWLGSNPALQENRIAGQDEEGIFVDRHSRPRLFGNTVTGNAIGLALYPGGFETDLRQFEGNGEDVRTLGGNGGAP